MANVATTPEDILKVIRTDVVFGEMRAIFDVADSKPWFYVDTWDKKSFGKVEGKKQIVFKTSYQGVMNIINTKRTSKWVSHSVAKAKSTFEPKIQTLGKPHIYLMIGAQTVKFEGTKDKGGGGGGKKGPSAATMTKMQELGSAWVFYQALSKGNSWSSWDRLFKDPEVKKVLGDIWNHYGDSWEESGAEWAMNFWIQQKALVKKMASMEGCCQFDNYTHSNEYKLPGMSSDSFMDWISSRVGKMGVTGKDNWNPADIWLIQSKEEKKARESIDDILNNSDPVDMKRDKVNAYMRGLFQKHKIFGISLKKITKGEAKVVFFNHTEDFFTKNWKGEGAYKGGTDNVIMDYASAVCKCGKIKEKGKWTMETQDMIFNVKDPGGDLYRFQIKGNNSTEFSGLKYEPTAVGHGEARLGKATVELVMANLKKHNVGGKFSKEKTSYPYTADEFIANKGASAGGWLGMIGCLFTNRVEMGSAKNKEEAYDNILAVFDEANGSPHVANAKLQEIKWLCAFFDIQAKERPSFATDMVWLAMKSGRAYGPYAKIS